MRQLLDSNLELVVQSGFIYAPLLFDPAIESEIRLPRKANVLMEVDGKLFVKTLSLQSLVENYEKLHQDSYEQLRSACLKHYHLPDLSRIPVDGKLRTILFHIMPHFMRRKKDLVVHRRSFEETVTSTLPLQGEGVERGVKRGQGTHQNQHGGVLERRRPSEEEILEVIGERIPIPARYYKEADKFLDTDSLRGALQALEKQRATVDPPGDGLISASKLHEWVLKALEAKIVDREKGRLRQALRGSFVETQRKSIAILLYIVEKGALEIDGFGFSRIGLTDDYLIYKHTGEFALKDFYGRLYLFPDCRVAVSTIPPFKPFVIDLYKHPFLEGYEARQEICLRHFNPPRVFTAANVIKALEEGLNAFLYGYSSRRRNGYHSLDRITTHLWTVDSDDPLPPDYGDYPVIRTRRVRPIDFEDYRIPRDHPKIASGQVAITNNYTL